MEITEEFILCADVWYPYVFVGGNPLFNPILAIVQLSWLRE